jgi:uncharacterized protein YehS (DUF1456 family)
MDQDGIIALEAAMQMVSAMRQAAGITDGSSIDVLAGLNALRKNDQRYRWLRDNANEHWDACFDNSGRHLLEGDCLDAGVDAAMTRTPAVG